MFAAIRRKLKGWKTIILNALVGLPATALFVLDQIKQVDLGPLLPPDRSAAILAGMALAGIVLRFVTDGPVGAKPNKEPDEPDYSAAS